MVPPLPNELVQNILEHAVDSYIDWDSPELDILAADRSIRELSLAASLVSPSWRLLAQDLLLRRVGVTLKNYQTFIRRVKERGPGFASSIRSLRVIGEQAVSVAGISAGDRFEAVSKATSLMNTTTAVLPAVKHIALVQILAFGHDWLVNILSVSSLLTSNSDMSLTPLACLLDLRNLHFFDSGFIRPANEQEVLCGASLTLSSLPISQLTKAEKVHMATTTLESKMTFNAIRCHNLGFDLQAFIAVNPVPLWGLTTLKSLTISCSAASRIHTFLESPWTTFTSLQTLSARFEILLDANPLMPSRLAPPHPLSPTLRTLELISNSATPAESTSSPLGPQIAGRSLADATAILLATIKDLPNLEELVVEDAPHEGKLTEECEARGIRLRSSVGV
ncbi:hypothetical protein BCR35DRAFT_303637 [Leucosporidium creatinivorum]|uniref:F-box domain-containing protein n=1 Tax=Leucosporidium creatinivorum TaxID=106004 RepID=A0A1Y2FGA8_9BASI|nr:hypothetical protein BCR35DRAFT_303637 [Leucosporidium creatinivorum]